MSVGLPVHRWLARLAGILSALCNALAALLTALLALLIVWVVWQRFVAGTTPRWGEELPRLVLVWVVFVGAVTCSHERTHLVAGMLPWLVRRQVARRWIERANHGVIVVCLAVLAGAGWQLASLTMGQNLTALELPAGLVYLAVPLACAASALVHLAHCCTPAVSAADSGSHCAGG